MAPGSGIRSRRLHPTQTRRRSSRATRSRRFSEGSQATAAILCVCPPSLPATRRRRRRFSEGSQAGRLLANLIVMGGTVVGRAMLQAYRQAIVNANKTGAVQEAISGIKRASKAMTDQEARQILDSLPGTRPKGQFSLDSAEV